MSGDEQRTFEHCYYGIGIVAASIEVQRALEQYAAMQREYEQRFFDYCCTIGVSSESNTTT